MKKSLAYILLFALSTTMACSTKATDSKDRAESEGPTTTLLGSFDSDSAYKFVA